MGATDLGTCPYQVKRPLMLQGWRDLTFLHWSFPPRVVQRLLPAGLEVEPLGGKAWVGLVPFRMEVGVPGVPMVPWASRFCETNVRTYVRDGCGRSGVWFFSLDASRLAAVVVARTTYRLPYFWSAMRATHDGNLWRYRCLRRWPGPRGATSSVDIKVGNAYQPGEATAEEHFLTARWALFSVVGPRRRFALAQHAPWPLYRAQALAVHDELLPAAGLPAQQTEPLVHWSPGVSVRIGRPECYS